MRMSRPRLLGLFLCELVLSGFLFFGHAFASSGASQRWTGFDDAALDRALAALPEAQAPDTKTPDAYSARVAAIAQRFLDAPYQFSPLGEGVPPDSDPLWQLERFDCLSLVETVLALAAAHTAAEARRHLQSIRYLGDQIDFVSRKHFTEFQWIPDNIRQGWIEDITRQIAPEYATTLKVRMSAAAYREWSARTHFPLPLEQAPIGEVALPIIPLRHVTQLLRRLKPGTLVFVVRAERASAPYRISHAGLIVSGVSGPREGRSALNQDTLNPEPFLLEAKDQGPHRVIQTPLRTVIAHYQSMHTWPIIGLSLGRARIKEPTQANPQAPPTP